MVKYHGHMRLNGWVTSPILTELLVPKRSSDLRIPPLIFIGVLASNRIAVTTLCCWPPPSPSFVSNILMRGSTYYIGSYNNNKRHIYLSFMVYVGPCNKCSMLKLSLVTVFFHFTAVFLGCFILNTLMTTYAILQVLINFPFFNLIPKKEQSWLRLILYQNMQKPSDLCRKIHFQLCSHLQT